jgi:hypothetical protein
MNRPMRPPGPSGGTAPPSGGSQALKAFAVIAAVVAIGAVVLSKGPSSTKASTATTKKAHVTTTLPGGVTTTTTPALINPSSIRLQVLNGVGSGSYAGLWSAKLKANPGYNTQPANDALARVATSEIFVITPGFLPEANALAATVGIPASAVVRTIPAPLTAPIRASERAIANLVLVVGPDLAGRA